MKNERFNPIEPAPVCPTCGRAFDFDVVRWRHTCNSRCELATIPSAYPVGNDGPMPIARTPATLHIANSNVVPDEDWEDEPGEYTEEMRALADAGLIPGNLSWRELDFWERELNAAKVLVELMEAYERPDQVPLALKEALGDMI